MLTGTRPALVGPAQLLASFRSGLYWVRLPSFLTATICFPLGLQEMETTPVAGGRVSQFAPPTFPLATPKVYIARAPSAKVTQKVAAMVGFQWTPVTLLLEVLRTWEAKGLSGVAWSRPRVSYRRRVGEVEAGGRYNTDTVRPSQEAPTPCT